jgi:hypothetical protein
VGFRSTKAAALLLVLALGCGTRAPGALSFDVSGADAEVTPDAGADATADTADVVEDAGQPQPPPIRFMQQDASPAQSSDCAHDATAYVFVLSSVGDLYRFAPDLKVFTKIGALGCSSPSVPNSMAVDRHATAWVNYLDGTVRAVNTADAGCGRTINMPSDWGDVGMGFATSDAGAANESLFLAGAGTNVSSGLGRLDLDAGTVAPVGSFTAPLTATDTELTGTGDGRLFGFFASSPVRLAQISETSAAIVSSTPFTQIGTPQSFAFSFWGGRFYFYTYPNSTPGTSTNVTEYDPKTGALNTTYMTDIGFLIVGAGVSTCAPTMPPPPK